MKRYEPIEVRQQFLRTLQDTIAHGVHVCVGFGGGIDLIVIKKDGDVTGYPIIGEEILRREHRIAWERWTDVHGCQSFYFYVAFTSSLAGWKKTLFADHVAHHLTYVYDEKSGWSPIDREQQSQFLIMR